jgi:hypothetical protein
LPASAVLVRSRPYLARSAVSAPSASAGGTEGRLAAARSRRSAQQRRLVDLRVGNTSRAAPASPQASSRCSVATVKTVAERTGPR